MESVPLTSSSLAAVAYDEKRRLLTVEFYSGRVYEYEGVPRETVEGLRTAPSAGRYFTHNIRDAYPYRRIR